MKKLTLIIAIFTVFFSHFLITAPAMATDTPIFQVTAGDFGLCREPGEKTATIEVAFRFGLPMIFAQDIWLEGLGMESLSTATFFVFTSQIEDIVVRLHSHGHWENIWVNWVKTNDGFLQINRAIRAYPGDQFKLVVTANGNDYELPLNNSDLQPFIKLHDCALGRNGLIEIK